MFTTWLGLSVPIVYLYFALAGSCLVVKNIFAKRAFVLNLFENRFLVLTAVLFFAPFFATVLIKGLIYDTWRHLYFTFPLLIILALYGAKMIYEMFENKARYGVFVFLFGALIFQGCWIIKNHPYQDAYFNIVGAQIADKFMRDYYAASTHQALIYLLQNEPSNKQISAAYYPFPAQVAVSLSMFSYRDKMRFRPVQDIEHAEYVISHFYNTAGNELKIKGFVEMHAIWIDGYKILTILKRI
jgi:hypothetical protein